jgi:hypothetical protein
MLSRLLFVILAALMMIVGGQTLPPSSSHCGDEALAAQKAIVVNVRHYGAKGDGKRDDAEALRKAIRVAAARPGSTVYLPRGTYYCSTPVRLASNVNLRGEGMSVSWLKTRLEFGSYCVVSKLKIGRPGDCAVTNSANATRSRFRLCRLRGGGSTEGAGSSVLYLGGDQGDVSRVLFSGCKIERTSYVPPAGVDPWTHNVGNTIAITDYGDSASGAHVQGITFRDCHLGASNGVARGALRMMMEAYVWDGDTGLAYHGWRNLTFDGCTIEASDTHGLDFADRPLRSDPTRHSASGVLVTGCTFRGARRNDAFGHGGVPIAYECPTGMVIKDNLFYASPHDAIGGSHVGRNVVDAPGLLIQGNTFDMTRSPVGLNHEAGEPCVGLTGYGSRVIDNTFIYNRGVGLLISSGNGEGASGAARNVVRGNTFTDRRTSGGEPTIWLLDDPGLGSHDNRIVGNTIRNRACGTRGVIAQTSGDGTNYAADNVIYCGTAVPFVVRSGELVRTGNRIL